MRIFVGMFVVAYCARAAITYKVQLTANEDHRIVELSPEQYAAGVLAGESSTFRNDEALKAMAVAARTYAARLRGRHSTEGFDFCSTTHCQRFEMHNVAKRLTDAAAATMGELLWYEGGPAFTVYSRNCGGKAESVSTVWPDIQAPYLPVHADPYCTRAANSSWSWSAPPAVITEALSASKLTVAAQLQRVIIRERTASGRARALQLEGTSAVVVSASSFRFAIARELGWSTIRSDLYEIQNGRAITFHGKGQGHGVGMCQEGADEMGVEGHSYQDILAFYYPGTSLSRLATGFHWTQMAGEGIVVLSIRPNEDGSVLRAAETARHHAEDRVHIAAPNIVTLRVYPTLDAFRNATGEPGWVAAHAVRSTIDLQPASVLNRTGALQSVLDHEMLHVLIESRAAPGLPVWFREGLVEYLSNGPHVREYSGNPDAAIRQRQSRAAAENAYADALASVAALVKTYGEPAVLGWVTRGLPAEVKNSISKSENTNSK